MSEPRLSVNSLMRVVEQSLFNEMLLDIYLKEKYDLGTDSKLPDFKVLKLVNIKKRIGFLWSITLLCSPFLVVTKILIQWLLSIVYSFSKNTFLSQVFILTTSVANNERIKKCVADLPGGNKTSFQLSEFGFLSSSQAPFEVVKLICENCRSIFKLFFGVNKNKLSLILHYHNSFEMLLLAKFVNSNPQFIYATDDHYQRWAFVMSHVADRLHIVQHGYLDIVADINFQYKFGRAENIFIWREQDKSKFSCYINCDQFLYAPLALDLVMSELGDQCLFLASSSPHLDIETDFLRVFKKRSNVKVIVKLHPLHNYHVNVEMLLSQADEIWEGVSFPFCKVFVSFNSALEVSYSASGCSVIRLENYASPHEATDHVLRSLQ